MIGIDRHVPWPVDLGMGDIALKVLQVLQVILHIGAHRTGTTTLQQAIQKNQYNLRQNGLTYWGPRTTRGGIFSGLLRRAEVYEEADTIQMVKRNSGAIRMEMDRLQRQKQRSLLISEENIMGSMRNNLRDQVLYPGLRRRLVRFADIFGAHCGRVALTIRPYQDYWSSTMAYAIPAGHRAPDQHDLEQLTHQKRGWRQVIGDVSAAFPKAEIMVWEFDRFIGKSGTLFQMLTRGLRGPLRFQPFVEHHNASVHCAALRGVLLDRGDHAAAVRIRAGDGRYMPFDTAQTAQMSARYQEDVNWLRFGAPSQVNFMESAVSVQHRVAGFANRGVG